MKLGHYLKEHHIVIISFDLHLVGAYNKEKALVEAFSRHCENFVKVRCSSTSHTAPKLKIVSPTPPPGLKNVFR